MNFVEDERFVVVCRIVLHWIKRKVKLDQAILIVFGPCQLGLDCVGGLLMFIVWARQNHL